ncbi:MAG: GumC family protein [Salinarimonas sp.]|nr:GumC family protein [Salinarimonas sp.]
MTRTTIDNPSPRDLASRLDEEDYHSAGSVEFADLWKIIRLRWRTVALIASVPILVAGAYALFASEIYTATVQLHVDPRERQVLTNDLSPTSLSADGGVAQVESQQRIIMSDSVLSRVVDQLRLFEDPEFISSETRGPLGPVLRAVGLERINSSTDQRLAAVRQLRKKVSVERPDRVFVIDVSVGADNPDKAARIANGIAQAYLEDRAASRAASSNEAADAISLRLSELQERVRLAESEIETFKSENSLVDASGTRIDEQQISELSGELMRAQSRTAEARARFEQVEALQRSGSDLGGIDEAISSPVIATLRGQYAATAQEYADLRETLGERHPAILAAQARLAEIDARLQEELQRTASVARGLYERAQSNENDLRLTMEAATQRALTTGQALVNLRELEREAEASRAVYEAFLLRAREAREFASIDNTNVRVVSSASAPDSSSWPPRGLLLAASVVGGVFFGAGGAFLREYSQPLVLSRRQLSDTVGLPIYAVLRVHRQPLGLFQKRAALNSCKVCEKTQLGLVARRVLLCADGSGTHRPRGSSLLVLPTDPRNDELAEKLVDTVGADRDNVVPVLAAFSTCEAIKSAIKSASDTPPPMRAIPSRDFFQVIVSPKTVHAQNSRNVSPTANTGNWHDAIDAYVAESKLVVIAGRSDPEHETTQSLTTQVDGVILLVHVGEPRSTLSESVEMLRLSGAPLVGAIFVDEH